MAHKAQYFFFSFLLPTISVYVILGVYKISYKFTHLKKHISIQPWRFPGPRGRHWAPHVSSQLSQGIFRGTQVLNGTP